jgi:alpha-beta hydrolase superfamily lysophospholipase
MSSSGALPSPGPAGQAASGSSPGVPEVRRPRRWRRRLLWSVLAAVIALALVFFAGGGWYFAGQIRSDALAVEPGTALPAYTDVRVVGVAPGLVRLRAIGSRPALFKPELDGIAWRGGFGHLGASVAVSGGVVTRPLTVVSGSPPRAGQLAGLDTSYFLGDPGTALGIPMRDVVVHGPLGPLPAWYFPGRGSTFVIGVHGRNSTPRSLLRVVGVVHDMGFPALSVTYRNDLGVARDPSGYLRYGEAEWPDLQAAVRWALAHGARRVILAGLSMGGGIVAAFLEHSPLASKVVRVVFDAPMLDLQATVAYGASQRSLPVTGGSIPAPLVWTAETIVTMRFGVDWSATDYLSDTSWLKVPTLVFHGTDDTTVPISTSIRLKQLKPSLVTLAVFPGAGHVESWNIDRARYTTLLESFLSPVAP